MPVGSKPETPYGSAKEHKPLNNRLPLFRFQQLVPYIQNSKILSSHFV